MYFWINIVLIDNINKSISYWAQIKIINLIILEICINCFTAGTQRSEDKVIISLFTPNSSNNIAWYSDTLQHKTSIKQWIFECN